MLRSFHSRRPHPATVARRVQARREIMACITLNCFVLSQWLMPLCLSVQPAQAREMVPAPSAKSAASSPNPVPTSRGKGAKSPTRLAKAQVKPKDAPPAWYIAARKREANQRRQMDAYVAASQGKGKVRLAQFAPPSISKLPPNARVTRVEGTETTAVAASGMRLLTESFPVPLQASASLSTPPAITPLKSDLGNERVPGQQEIVAMGGLAGPLSPVAPADPVEFANQVDTKLRQEGFDKGLVTAMPPSEDLILDAPRYKAAKHLEEMRERVKAARSQNREFALSMQKWNDNRFKEATGELTEYAKKYPKSPWTPEALIQVANYAKFTGQGNEAEDGYRKVMEMTSGDPKEMSYNAHRKAFGRLTDLYLIEGRYGEVKPMLEDFLYSDTNWRRRTWGLYWLAQISARNADKKRLLAERDCGTKALGALFAQTNHPHQARAVVAMLAPRDQGFSLAELQTISAKQGVTLAGFQATPTQLRQVKLPVLLHYGPEAIEHKVVATKGKKATAKPFVTAAQRYGHFVMVRSYNAKHDQWGVLNPQDGTSAQLTSAQLGRQWSGRGLMMQPAPKQAVLASVPPVKGGSKAQASTTKPLVRLSLSQMRSTYGTGYAVQNQDGNGCDGHMRNKVVFGPGIRTNKVVCASCGGKDGACTQKREPMVAVNQISQNIFITDTPVWYTPAKGPEVDITLSYNSQDASNYNTMMGNKWSFGYGSYAAELPNVRTTIYMPDGNQVAFTPINDNGTTANYSSPSGDYSTLVKTAQKTFTLTTQMGDKRFFGIPSNLPSYTIPVLLEERDRWGYSLTFTYGMVNGIAVPFQITDADGKVTRLQYDSAGHLIYAQTPDERQASFSYDSNGNLIQCVDAAGQAFQYAYDGMVVVTQLNTAQGAWTFSTQTNQPYQSNPPQYVYYKTTIYDPTQAKPETFLFDGHYQGIHQAYYEYSDHQGNKTTYDVASLGGGMGGAIHSAITAMRVPGVTQVGSSYNNNYSSQSLDPSSTYNGRNSTSYTYNSQGQVTQIVTGGGYNQGDRTAQITYDTNGLDPVQVVASGSLDGTTRQSLTTLQSASYNGYHQPLSLYDAAGHEVDYSYTSWGALLSVTTHEGSTTHVTQYAYGQTSGSNEKDRIVSVSRDNVLLATYTHDMSGRVRTAMNVTGLTTTYRYNNLDKLLGVYYPDGTSQLTNYTCCALPGMVTDRSGRRSYCDYDQLKRLVRVQDADGQTLQYDYNADGDRTSMLDANGVRTRWDYDGAHRATTKTYADGTHESCDYYPSDGLPWHTTNGRGQTTTFAYSYYGDLMGTDRPNSPDTSFTFDALGRKVSMTDGIGTTSWGYDSYGRLAGEDGPFANDNITYEYDTLNRIQTLMVGRNATNSDNEGFTYDGLGRLSTVSANAGGTNGFGNVGTFSYSYVGNTSLLQEMDRPNGTKELFAYENSSTANALHRLVGVQDVTSTNANISTFGYGYDSPSVTNGFRDNRTSQSRQYGSDPAQSLGYSYNPTSMLLGESGTATGTNTPAVSKSYVFDPMGNRTQSIDYTAHTRVDSTYNPLNQLASQNQYTFTSSPSQPTANGSTAFVYDGDGNMALTTSKDASGTVTSQSTYTYDDASRLVGIETPGVAKWVFFYDGMSRLRVSQQFNWVNSAWSLVQEKHRVYVGMDVVQERDANNAVTASDFRTGNIGKLLCRATSTGGVFYGYDGSGNVTSLTGATGAVVGNYTYDAWGNLLASSGTKAADNPFRYSTKEQIAGLYYYGYRFYSPGLGRWINRDPIGESGGTNIYAFVGNEPLRHLDSYGHALLTDDNSEPHDPGEKGGGIEPSGGVEGLGGGGGYDGGGYGGGGYDDGGYDDGGYDDGGYDDGGYDDGGYDDDFDEYEDELPPRQPTRPRQPTSPLDQPSQVDIQKLSDDEVSKLEDREGDIHQFKEGCGGKPASHYDLYKNSNGDIYMYRKGGIGEGVDTGVNIKNLR